MLLPWQHQAAHQPQQIALRDHSQGECFSWLQLQQLIDHKVDFLQNLPLKTGAALALSGKNSLDLLCFYLAALQLKLPVLCLNPAFTADKIQALCQANHISYWIDCQRDFALQYWQYADFPAQAWTLTLTSGSTGAPKAVVHHIQQHLANAKAVCELMDFQAGDCWLLSLPLYHVSGQGIVWRWLLQGAELALPSEDFYPNLLEATHASLVPTQAQRLLQYLAEQPQTAVKTRAILLGGAQIPAKICAKCTALGIKTYSGYGMTEMASTVFAKQNQGESGVGMPLADREFQIVEQELWLRGAGLALGYWQGKKLQPLINEQGWLQTKDKAHWDGKQLQLLGRLDNMFISGGENIQPEEIEALIQQYENVKQVFVLPQPDQEFGQRPVAFISFITEFNPQQVAELKAWLADKIEKFKQPVAYFALDFAEFSQGAIKISRATLQAKLSQLSTDSRTT